MLIKLTPSDLRYIKTIKETHPSLSEAQAVNMALRKLAQELRKAEIDRIIRF